MSHRINSHQIIALLISVLAGLFLMLGLAGCVVQPIAPPAPVVLSTADELMVVSLDAVSMTLLPPDTLVLVPMGVLSDTALTIDSSGISTDTAVILPLAMMTELPADAAVFVDAETLAENTSPVVDIVPIAPITIAIDSMMFINIDPGADLSGTMSMSESVDIPLTIWAFSGAEGTASSSGAICRTCLSPEWICCMMGWRCCSFSH